MREQVGNFDAALPVPFKRALRAEQLGVTGHELVFRFAETGRSFLPVKFGEQRLGMEGSDRAGAATQEKEDDRFGLGGLVRFLRRQWIYRLRAGLLLREHRAEGQSAEPTEGVAEKFPPVACDSN